MLYGAELPSVLVSLQAPEREHLVVGVVVLVEHVIRTAEGSNAGWSSQGWGGVGGGRGVSGVGLPSECIVVLASVVEADHDGWIFPLEQHSGRLQGEADLIVLGRVVHDVAALGIDPQSSTNHAASG